jgi:hypothetical protein
MNNLKKVYQFLKKTYGIQIILGLFLSLVNWLTEYNVPVIFILLLLFSGLFIESIVSLIKNK